MTEDEAEKLPDGVYRLYWVGGDSSLATVYHDHQSVAWFAPENWTGPSVEWFRVVRAERVVIPCDPFAPKSPAPLADDVRELREKARLSRRW